MCIYCTDFNQNWLWYFKNYLYLIVLMKHWLVSNTALNIKFVYVYECLESDLHQIYYVILYYIHYKKNFVTYGIGHRWK